MNLVIENRRDAIRPLELLVLFGWEAKAPRLPRGVKLAPHVLTSFRGEFRELRATEALAGGVQRVLLVGLGKPEAFEHDRLRRLGALALKEAERFRAASLGLWLPPEVETTLGSAEVAGQALAEGVRLGSYSFQDCKSKPKKARVARVVLWGGGVPFRRGGERGDVVAAANLYARRLQDAPANRMRPRDLAAAARALATRRIRVRVLDQAACKRLGMGSFLSVARGSAEPPCLIHLVYRPRRRTRARIALVGKGLTFDAGGISLKPAAKMEEMKYDMSGGAAVLGVFRALHELELPFELHGLVAATENLPDGRANKPGDVVEAMDGTTIEIQNTDAEGRLVLADALVYAQRKLRPDVLIDLATLTGAVITALGHELSGVLGNDTALQDELVRAGRECGELVWPLPLLDIHKEHMKSRVADLKNINAGQGAGASAGAAFLAHFVKETPWAHLDIAGSAWGADERDYQGGPGGTGVGVRLLLAYLAAKA